MDNIGEIITKMDPMVVSLYGRCKEALRLAGNADNYIAINNYLSTEVRSLIDYCRANNISSYSDLGSIEEQLKAAKKDMEREDDYALKYKGAFTRLSGCVTGLMSLGCPQLLAIEIMAKSFSQTSNSNINIKSK